MSFETFLQFDWLVSLQLTAGRSCLVMFMRLKGLTFLTNWLDDAIHNRSADMAIKVWLKWTRTSCFGLFLNRFSLDSLGSGKTPHHVAQHSEAKWRCIGHRRSVELPINRQTEAVRGYCQPIDHRQRQPQRHRGYFGSRARQTQS
jgi:hypothetical protein